MQLRPYQHAFIDGVESGWKEFSKQLGVAPTGSGKTIIFSWLAKRLYDSTGKKTLILAHREELIDQAIDKLHAATGIFAEKEKAEFRASKNSPVVVASIQSMIRRLDNWPKEHFGLVVADEAHHAISQSWNTVLSHFNASVLGVTATSDRGDKRSLGEYFENIAYEISLIDLIKDGFLSPITIRSVPLQIDLTAVSQIAGDFDAGELSHVLEPYMGQIALAIKQYAGNRKTLCFLPLISTSQKFVAHCLAAGLVAEHIDGNSPDRKEKLAAFERGDFQLLSNAMLLTEGYDCPEISCVVVLRPTRSRPLYAQMAGRGTRTFPGKENLLLLDFLWLHEEHAIVHPASLIAKDEEEAESITRLIEERESGGESEDQDLIAAASDSAHEREEKLRAKLAALAERKAHFISADEFAMKFNRLAIAEFQPTMKWQEARVTEKQQEWIVKAGIDVESVRGKGHASQLLSLYFENKGREPASNKQKWVMRQKGWADPRGIRTVDMATNDDARKFFASMNGRRKAA